MNRTSIRFLPQFVLACALASPGFALAAAVTLDGSFGRTAGPIFSNDGVYSLTPAQGMRVGSNLFFSLGKFNLNAVETAEFSGSPKIANVITRVTGGLSTIDGTIQCDIPNANFLLIDSQGVAFGPDASLNVSGSFAVTTADVVKLADGTSVLATGGAADVTLTTAAPAAFGFLSAHPQPVVLNQSYLQIPGPASISVVSGDVKLKGGTLLVVGGRITVVSVGSPGTATLDPADLATPVALTGFTNKGNVRLIQQAALDTEGPAGGGQIVVRGGQILLDNSMIEAQPFADVGGIGIDLQADSVTLQNDSAIDTTASGAGNAGSIGITTDTLQVLTGSQITSYTADTGRGGNVTVNVSGLAYFAGVDSEGTGTGIASDAEDTASGRSGNVVLTAGSLKLLDGAEISSGTSGAGNGGNLTATVRGKAVFSGADLNGFSSGISAGSDSDGEGGHAGNVTVSAGSLQILDGAQVSSATFGLGQGGTVTVNVAGPVTISGRDPYAQSGIYTNAQASGAGGNGGDILLTAGSLQLLDGGVISSSTVGRGNGGDVTVNTSGSTVLSGVDSMGFGSGVYAESDSNRAGGNAGTITLAADSLQVASGAQISSASDGLGNGGDVVVNVAGLATVQSGGQIQVAAPRSNGGSIHVSAGGGIDVSDATISAEAGRDGGNVSLQSNGLLRIENGIVTAMAGGNGGAITLDPPLVVLQGSTINGLSGGSPVVVEILAPLLEQNTLILTNTDQTFPQIDLSGVLVTLPPPAFGGQVELEPTCEHEAGTNSSSFIVVGRGGVPPVPGGFVPDSGDVK